jgi:Sulfotransferase family
VSCGYLSPEEFEGYFKFSFVRNPWDSIISEYKYRGYPVRLDFKTYLFKHLPEPGFTDTYCHILPQYDFLFDERGTLLVDFVGKYESLQADFDTVCAGSVFRRGRCSVTTVSGCGAVRRCSRSRSAVASPAPLFTTTSSHAGAPESRAKQTREARS